MISLAIAMPSHLFIPASADLSKPYLKVLAVGSLRLEACTLIEGSESQRTVGTDYFIKKTDTKSLLIYDLAGTARLATLLEHRGKNADIVLFFGKETETLEDELKRLGLSEGKTYDIPVMDDVNNGNFETKIMSFLNEVLEQEHAFSRPRHPCHEDKLKSCQIL